MKRIATLLCGLAFAVVTAVSQTAPSPTFLTVTYYQVEPEKRAQYNQLLATSAKKFYQSRVDSGDVMSWHSYRVVIPDATTSTPYSHVAVINWAKHPILDLSEEASHAAFTKAGLNRAAEMDRIRSTGRKMVKREVWRLLDTAGEPPGQGDFVRVDPRRVTPLQEYFKLEQDVYKPNHVQRIKHGMLKGWGVLALGLPGGDAYPYNAATVETFKDEAQMFNPPRPPQNLLKLAHPDRDVSAEMKRMLELKKDQVRTLLRVDHMVAAKR